MSGGEVIGREGSPPLQHHQSVSTASAACAATHALPAAHRPLPPGGAVLHAHCVCGGCIWAANVLRGDQGHLHGDPLNKQKENRKSTWKGIFSVLHIKHEIRPNLTYSLDFFGRGGSALFLVFFFTNKPALFVFPPHFSISAKVAFHSFFVPVFCSFFDFLILTLNIWYRKALHFGPDFSLRLSFLFIFFCVLCVQNQFFFPTKSNQNSYENIFHNE